MITLKSDNRDLTQNTKYSYLGVNYASGRTTLVVLDSGDFQSNDWVLIGEWGSETSEIKQVSSKANATNTLTINSATKFSYAESTKISILNYDQVRFFYTTTATFSATSPLRMNVLLGDETTQFDITNPAGTTFRYTYDTNGTNPWITKFVRTGYTVIVAGQNFNAANNGTFVVTGVDTNYFEITNAAGVAENNVTIGTGSVKVNTNYLDIDPTTFFTKLYDTTNTTGFGWFVFYNSTTAKASSNSNAIPYAGFAENSVKSILDDFFSTLNNKELKLISTDDAYRWLNEAYANANNSLNLVNREYKVSDEYTVTVASGISEYSLPSDFSDIISVFNGTDDVEINPIDLADVPAWDGGSDNAVRYYLRGAYIGFTPTPGDTLNYTIRYKTKSTALNSYYDNIEMPDNNFYFLKDFMMYRAAPKLGRGDGVMEYTAFNKAIEEMKITSHKRNNALESWNITNAANL